ncbi:Glycosyl hydrolase, BNR repeat protein [Labilithrix luteola]|uniref:Glycosyl hydrolase, BNR repeat protein n=1 Tax=Labilithrix luteola TaxID=1391654 RepID=A0A0K1PXC5_9BACT|nr:hypothetical protein [Labilithrix luteola]AKU98173.1 Glycosyl hydrolase, BNR repeat protein [Labilithrix luteola]
MRTLLFHSRGHRRGVLTVAGLVALGGISLAACAESSNEAPTTPDSSVIAPSEDATADAASDADADAADAAIVLPDVPCAVGNVCHVPTTLTVGSFSALAGRSNSDVWAAGSLGLMIHWDGHVWTDIRSTEVPKDLSTMTGLSLSADWAYGVAGPIVMRRGLSPDSVHKIDTFIPYAFTSIVFLDNGHGYIGASEGSLAPPGTGGLLIELVDFDGVGLMALPPPVVAANNAPMPMNIQALFAVPGNALWAVGQRGTIAHYPLAEADAGPGEGMVLPLANQNNLFAAWGQGDQLWAVGEAGTVIHIDGTTATEEASGTTTTLNAVFGFSKSDIWAAGDSGTLLHFDGKTWSRIPIQGYSGKLRTIWGASPDDVWIGGEGAMFHWGPLP